MSAVAPKTNGRGPRVPLAVPSPPVPEPGSEATPHLDAAVLAVQAEAGKLVRNAIGQIQNRTYGYVTLDAVVDEVLPLLVEHELLWRTFPTVVEAEPCLRYRMTHVPTGESDEDVMSLACAVPGPQGQGSAITYARRYALCAYLQLTVDQDDDGRGAMPGSKTENTEHRTENSKPSAAPAKGTERRATAKQRGMLEAKARAGGLQAGDFANVILKVAGDPPRSWSDEAHADQTLRRLLDHLPARLVNAVIEGIAGARS